MPKSSEYIDKINHDAMDIPINPIPIKVLSPDLTAISSPTLPRLLEATQPMKNEEDSLAATTRSQLRHHTHTIMHSIGKEYG